LYCTHGIWKYPLFLVPTKISYTGKPPYELLVWGHRQYDIANTLHMSQPTASRDIHYIQKEIRKSTENYGEHLFGLYRNNLLGLDEMIKKLWTIVHSPKTDTKQKIKSIMLIWQYCRERVELVRSEPSLVQQVRHMDSVKWSSFILALPCSLSYETLRMTVKHKVNVFLV
jgi:hypothetical protein